jgi:hypothetical protein
MMNPISQGYRPCGACRAYVPAAIGCRKHWKPDISAGHAERNGKELTAEQKRRRADAKVQRERERRQRQQRELDRLRLLRSLRMGLA